MNAGARRRRFIPHEPLATVDMRRRAFLAGLSATGTGLVAGCGSLFGAETPEPELDGELTPAPVPDEPTGTPPSGTEPGTETERSARPTGGVSVGRAPSLASPERFAGWDLPPFDVDDADRALRYDRADPAGAVVLGPVAEAFPADGTLSFALLNREGRPVALNPYTWRVLGHDGDEWYTETVGTTKPTELRVTRGGAYVWTAVGRYSSEPIGRFRHPFALLVSPGRYVFTIRGVYGANTDDATSVRFVAPFAAVE